MSIEEVLSTFKPIVDESIIDYRLAVRSGHNIYLAKKEIEDIKKRFAFMLSLYCRSYDNALNIVEEFYIKEEKRL